METAAVDKFGGHHDFQDVKRLTIHVYHFLIDNS